MFSINRFYFLILTVILFSVTNAIYGACPSLKSDNPVTQNEYGNSSYQDDGLGLLFTRLYFKGMIAIAEPIFIAGGGYGAEAYELLRMGAQEIYINDLSTNNLICAKAHLDVKFPKSDLKLISGDVTTNKLYHLHMKNKFGLITAKNVIQFLDGKQVDTFFNDSYSNLKQGGYLVLIYDNYFLTEQQTMISDINHRIDNDIKVDDAVKSGFELNTIGSKKMHCSFDEFIKTDASIRSSGYPCVMRFDKRVINLLVPSEVHRILSTKGFNVLINTNLLDPSIKLIVAKK